MPTDRDICIKLLNDYLNNILIKNHISKNNELFGYIFSTALNNNDKSLDYSTRLFILRILSKNIN